MDKPVPVVMHVISNLYDGGAEGVLYRLCVNSPHYKHVVVCMMDEGKYGPMLEAAEVTLYCLHMPKGKLTWQGVFQFWKVLHDLQPDVVQTWMYHADLIGGILARLSGVNKIFWGIRNGNLTRGTIKDNTIKIAKLCALLSTSVPKRIVSCSQRALLVHAAIGYEKRLISVIPNGYELTHFAPNYDSGVRLRCELGIGEDVFLFGMVARFDPQKDHSNLFAALNSLKQQHIDFHCVLVGNGMEHDNLQCQRLMQEYEVDDVVSLLGKRTDVPNVMNSLNVHVLSSLGEAFPNVIAEAMACGTPCVVTDVGDAAYIVGETGWIVQPRDSVALADCLQKAMKEFEFSPIAWRTRQLAARNRIVENFSIEKMVAAYAAVWDV